MKIMANEVAVITYDEEGSIHDVLLFDDLEDASATFRAYRQQGKPCAISAVRHYPAGQRPEDAVLQMSFEDV